MDLLNAPLADGPAWPSKSPRTEIEECKNRPELKKSGVYFLFGKSEDDGKGIAYIGQAVVRKNGEGVLNRLQEHIRNPDKDYWTEAVAFIMSNDSLGPTEICYLEHQFYEIARKAKRYIVKNGNDPSPGNISEEKESELDKFIKYAKLVIGILGHKVFEPADDRKSKPASNSQKPSGAADVVFHIGQKATGKRTSEGFIVFADSQMSENITDSLSLGYKNLRAKNAHLIDKDGTLKEHISFTSPSAAASFVLGRNANGSIEWKTPDGKSLKDIESEEAN